MSDRPKIIRGDDATFEAEITDQDGEVVDLTDAEAFFTVKKKRDDLDADAVVALKNTSHTDAEGGITTFVIPKATTNELEIGTYYYDVQVKFIDDTIKSAGYGTIEVVPDITRRET